MIKEYILSVCATALICVIVRSLLQKGTVGNLAKLMSGVFLLLAILSPLKQIYIPDWQDITLSYQLDAQNATKWGEESTLNALSQIIKEQTASYILERAQPLGLELSVDVILSSDAVPAPKTIYLTGAAGPYAKQQLQEIIIRELGITKENLIWT